MRRDDAIRILRQHQADLAEHRVRSLALFGSVARDEARLDSDVDLLVEFEVAPGLFGFIHLEQVLSDLLGVKVDLVVPSTLKPRIRERVLAQAIPI